MPLLATTARLATVIPGAAAFWLIDPPVMGFRGAEAERPVGAIMGAEMVIPPVKIVLPICKRPAVIWFKSLWLRPRLPLAGLVPTTMGRAFVTGSRVTV